MSENSNDLSKCLIDRKNLMLEKLEILISGSLGLFTWFISGSLVFENFPVFNNSNKIFRIEF